VKSKEHLPSHLTIRPDVLAEVKKIIDSLPLRRDLLIEYLHLIQDEYSCISKDHLTALADCLKISLAEVQEVASFYHHFKLVTDTELSNSIWTVRVCESLTCEMFGSKELTTKLERNISAKTRLEKVPCIGQCAYAPVVTVGQRVVKQATVEKVLACNSHYPEIANYETLNTYIASGGYSSLKKCTSGILSPVSVIELVSNSGLRGLGGAGFPTGKKWQIVLQQSAPRYLAVNIDEGEPGTFKDRTYLEKSPHRFLEGMLIAAWAVDAQTCFIYLRDEYAGCRQILAKEIKALEAMSLDNMPLIELRRGAGSYVCGEESAMVESIEGRRGIPRLRPPYIAEKGIFGRPTLEHNLETLYRITDVIRNGSNFHSSHGRHGRTGLISFSVSGRVVSPGMYLAPAGITLRELVEEYCNGMSPGHQLKAYFPGGASGGILPASLADIPLDFDTLQEYGCFIGSAAIIVLSDKDNVSSYAKNAMDFFAKESCGKCTPCRIGTKQASSLMSARLWDLKKLNDIARVLTDASICGLGQAAPNPMKSIMKYFKEEIS
jgi:formate dehydrogenase beta subunit